MILYDLILIDYFPTVVLLYLFFTVNLQKYKYNKYLILYFFLFLQFSMLFFDVKHCMSLDRVNFPCRSMDIVLD